MILQVTRKTHPMENTNGQFECMAKEAMKEDLKNKLFEVLQPYIRESNEGNKISYTVEFAESIENGLRGLEPTKIRVLKIYGE